MTELTIDAIAAAEMRRRELENPGEPKPLKAAPISVPAPMDVTAGTAPRKMPDVSTPEVIGAAGVSEMIETDYHRLTDREYDERMTALLEVAKSVGEEPRRNGYGPEREEVFGQPPLPLGDLIGDERIDTIMRAKAKNPDAFKGIPITREEIEADVNRSLRAEWDDAQATMVAAPDTFWSRTVPEFLGRAGIAATDETNLPIAIATAGIGEVANLGRLMLMEGGLSVLGEATTLPKQFEVAERLDIQEPDAASQLLFAGVVGAAIPVGLRGGGKALSAGVNFTNREIVARLRKDASALTPEQRAAVNAIERQVAEEDIGPAARGADNWQETDAAMSDIDGGRPPSADVPPSSAAKIEALTTPPKAKNAPAPGSTVTMDFAMGPNRPETPEQPVLDVISAAVEDAVGPGARVVVVSGQEGVDANGANRPQYGSNRHQTGDAADIAIFDADGNQITMETSPDLMREIARAASRRGAKGIGLGQEYMGGAHMHVDLVEPGPGQATAWGSEGKAMIGELDSIRGSGATPRAIEASIGDLIRDTEAGGSYDTPSSYSVVAPDKPLSQMTLDEVDAWQTANYDAGAESTAAGGYQFMRDTLRPLRERLGLTGSELFDREMQDKLGAELMKDAGLEDFKAGTITADAFADGLAKIWAAFPDASGSSVYAGDGLNKALIGREALIGTLTGEPYYSTGRPAPRMSRVKASGVSVDPKAYQFRTEVDAGGVGTPMDRVSTWDELLAGDFILHQRRDGQTFIADGHHRKQLAERLEAEGHPPIEFNAFVLREDDGYTVEHVRAIAAVKNIEAGSATAIDAAKVLRVDPAMLNRLTLRSTQARDARGLMQLSDDGFDMVTNGLVREDQAAAVPQISRDPLMQNALLRVLVQMKPRSMVEARQILADAYRAGLAKAERDGGGQASLFGDDFLPEETLFKERAEVMSKAMAPLRSDKRVFATLVRERDRIQEAGNALTDASNTQRLSSDELALGLVERLVNRAGPLDDALTGAARAVRSGGSARSAVTDFLGFVRDAIEGGGLARLLDGGDGRPVNAPTPDGVADKGARSGNGQGGSPDGSPGRQAEREADGQGPDAAAGEPDLADTIAEGFEALLGIPPVTTRDLLEAAQAKPMRGGQTPADDGLFDTGARDQFDMFADTGRVSDGAANDLFGDPTPTAPEVKGQISAAENSLREAMARGEDFDLPTGRLIDGEPEIMRASDVLADLDLDDEFLGVLNVCKS